MCGRRRDDTTTLWQLSAMWCDDTLVSYNNFVTTHGYICDTLLMMQQLAQPQVVFCILQIFIERTVYCRTDFSIIGAYQCTRTNTNTNTNTNSSTRMSRLTLAHWCWCRLVTSCAAARHPVACRVFGRVAFHQAHYQTSLSTFSSSSSCCPLLQLIKRRKLDWDVV